MTSTNWKHQCGWVKLEVHAIGNYTKLNLQLTAERTQKRLSICVSPKWVEELSDKPTQRTDWGRGRGLLLDRAGRATLEAETWSEGENNSS